MTDSYWQKQDLNQPLYSDLIWSRPETKARAGRLLIVGGSSVNIKEINDAYSAAVKAGVGSIYLAVPDVLQKSLDGIENIHFVKSTLSSSFALASLAELLDLSTNVDAVLFPGGLGKNSETAVLMERFISEYKKLLILSGDALDYFFINPALILERGSTLIATDFSKLQRLIAIDKWPQAVTKNMGLVHLTKLLHEYTLARSVMIVTDYDNNIIVASSSEAISTHTNREVSYSELSAYCAVWVLQNPDNRLEAAASAIYCYST